MTLLWKLIMIDYKLLRSEVKQNYTQQNIAEILSFIGYQIDRNYKFKLREDEKTPSASISSAGLITDFGSGWSGDIVSLLHECRNIPLGEATLYIAQLLHVYVKGVSK